MSEEAPVSVTVSESDAIATILLDRPERLNAWTRRLDLDYAEALRSCDLDHRVRAIVVTGAGRAFCAGADMAALQDMLHGGPRVVREDGPALPELTTRKPVIAAVNGAAVGLGFIHALACDVRIVADSAKLSTAFVRRGLVAEHGVSWLLTRAVGTPVALDLLLSGRVFDGVEAVRLGLASMCAPVGDVLPLAMDYARGLALNCSPSAMSAIKAQVWGDLHRGFDEADREAERLMVKSFAEPDFREGVESFQERRPPRFAALEKAR